MVPKKLTFSLYAFIATAIAGVIMVTTGFNRADGIATLVVVVLMAKAGLGLIRESGRIFLEAAPAGFDPAALGAEIAGMDEVTEVHDLHVWQITSGQPALSAQVLVVPDGDCHAVRSRIEDLLQSRHRITHSTLQVDHGGPGEPAEHCDDAHGLAYRSERVEPGTN